jgi:hypothetical protein
MNTSNASSLQTPENLIGVQYMTRGKSPRLCTVVDKHTTYAMDGSIFRERYVSTYDFIGQLMTNYDVVRTTIVMNQVK